MQLGFVSGTLLFAILMPGYAVAQKVRLTMLGRASGRHYLAFTGRERLRRETPQPTAYA